MFGVKYVLHRMGVIARTNAYSNIDYGAHMDASRPSNLRLVRRCWIMRATKANMGWLALTDR